MKIYFYIISLCAFASFFASCSTTSSIQTDEQLYTGMKKIYFRTTYNDIHTIDTQAEIEASLACTPNGAFFGSSYYRTPFPYGLWIWNAFSGKEGGVAKWITKSFGKSPVLITDVNPAMRANIAETILKNNGYLVDRIKKAIKRKG